VRSGLCPVLVQRDDELAALESALMAAQRGDPGFAVLSGEAGIGKTRLAIELARQARQLGCEVLAGSCSEAELSLPYLPFVEALGNYIDASDLAALAERLGPSRRELAQLFPQLADGGPPAQEGSAEQAKLRLFEAMVGLLAIPADESGLLLVIEDVHWADDSSRELLDHLARRLAGMRALVLVTFRRDELHRRHPFLPTLQGWRRAGVAEVMELEPLPEAGVGEMLAAILGVDKADAELRELMAERTEGNPFVLEEMVKEATVDGLAGGSGSLAIDALEIPATVRDAILLRLERFDPAHVEALEAGAVLGRTFDYHTLAEVAEAEEPVVQTALEAAITQQLLEEHTSRPGLYGWRHALTQEAIYTDIVTPRRQRIHSRAADVLSGRPSTPPFELAHHLFGAGRFDEAVPVFLQSAEEAARSVAFGEAAALLERALPHLHDPRDRALAVARIGRDHWWNGSSRSAERFLRDGIDELVALGESVEAARFRVVLGRCYWEESRPDLARHEYETARDVLGAVEPSADLAMAYVRLAGIHAFELDYEGCMSAAATGVEIAERAGAEFERVWALSFVALGLLDSGEIEQGFEMWDECYARAHENEFWPIAGNVTWNDIWTRTHMMRGGLEERLARFDLEPRSQSRDAARGLAAAYVKKVRGDLSASATEAERSSNLHGTLGYTKMQWRADVARADALVEQGRDEEAAEALPPPETRTELQDIVYDAPARVRLALARGDTTYAATLADEILENVDTFGPYRETLALGVEALIGAERMADAEAILKRTRQNPTTGGAPYLDEIEGRILLAQGDARAAIEPLRRFAAAAREAGYPLVELRGRTALARALAAAGDRQAAAGELREVATAADAAGARLVRREAEAVAEPLGIELPPRAEPESAGAARPDVLLPVGERLVTSLFADVRGYSELTARAAPADLADRMSALYRFAKVAVNRHQGVVDKFAGDAVMATFNVTGTRVDHCVDAVEAAMALRDRAALMGLPMGIGIAAGPAVLGRGSSRENLAVKGEATNLAARLQTAAGKGEILLSAEAHRRTERWLAEHGVAAEREELELKGLDGPQVAYRIRFKSLG
jgi:class 3 adenylate cyclase